jgi:hypothetical protein
VRLLELRDFGSEVDPTEVLSPVRGIGGPVPLRAKFPESP